MGVRSAAQRFAAMYPRQEPYALMSARTDLCGGYGATRIPTATASSPCFSSLKTQHTQPRTHGAGRSISVASVLTLFRARRAHRDSGSEEKSSRPKKKFRSGSTTQRSRNPTDKLRRPRKIDPGLLAKGSRPGPHRVQQATRRSLGYAAALSWPTTGATPSCCIGPRASKSALCSAIFPPLIRKVTVPA